VPSSGRFYAQKKKKMSQAHDEEPGKLPIHFKIVFGLIAFNLIVELCKVLFG
jgi:hypothetical protein